MTLIEVVNSGRKFRRTSVGGSFVSYEEFMEEYGLERSNLLATDYELAVDTGVTVTRAQLAAAWDSMRGSFTSVKASATSPVFAALASELFE